MHFKHYGAHALIATLSIITKTAYLIARIVRLVITQPIMLFWRRLARPIVFLLYRLSWRAMNATSGRLAPTKNTTLLLTSRSTLLPFIIALLCGFVVLNSVRVREVNAEEFGRNSMLAAMQDNEIIEESSSAVVDAHYLKESAGLASTLGTQDRVDTTLPDDLTAVTASGAIVKPALADSAFTKRFRQEVEYYVVRQGDTISTIAQDFDVSVNTILWENKLSARDLIRPGNKLTVLPSSGVSHQVKKGDTLAKIASKYNVTEDDIIKNNKLASADDIGVDQVLIIPGGVMPAPPAPKVTTQPYVSTRGLFTGAKPADATSVGGGMLWPGKSRKINQYFHYGHTGIDIEGDTGDPIYASDAGRVIKATNASWNGGYGMHIIVDHGNGIFTLYAHNSANYISVGDSVSKGQTIGAIGSTGRSTGPHVHFEVRLGSANGSRVNPLGYVK